MNNKSEKKHSKSPGKGLKHIESEKKNHKSIKSKRYRKELRKLEIELIKLQEWVKLKQLKMVVLFEGRDAAGKGGVIKRITGPLNPRICKIAALGTPTEKENHNGTFNDIPSICQLEAKLYCSTEAGTTVPALNT